MVESRDLLGGLRLYVLGTARRRILPRRTGMGRRGLGFAVLVSSGRRHRYAGMTWYDMVMGKLGMDYGRTQLMSCMK